MNAEQEKIWKTMGCNCDECREKLNRILAASTPAADGGSSASLPIEVVQPFHRHTPTPPASTVEGEVRLPTVKEIVALNPYHPMGDGGWRTAWNEGALKILNCIRELNPTARPLRRASMLATQLREYALKYPNMVMPAGVNDFFRNGRCVVEGCERTGCDMHHFFGSVHNMKSADIFRVPVCREHHIEKENDPDFRDYCLFTWVAGVARYLSDVAVGLRPAITENTMPPPAAQKKRRRP